MPQIHVLDVTNRDGVQTARTGLSKFGKTMVNLYLSSLGAAQSGIGFPFLFHEVPSPWTMAGAGIVVVSTLIITWREHVAARRPTA